MEYLPFGETLAEEHLNSNNSPYKFNGKQLDEETGNYYYGARYYDPKTSIWLSVDPLVEKYPGWSPYNYTLQNPVKLVDPDGRSVEKAKQPLDEWKLNKSGKLELVKRTDDDFNVFYDENGKKLFQTNKMSNDIKSEQWSEKTDEYINKMKSVFIEIASEPEVFKTMKKRASETGFDNSIITLDKMKSQGEYYMDIAPVDAALDLTLETPKWLSNPGSATKSIIQKTGEGIYKSETGTDFMQDINENMNKVWDGMKEFGNKISNGSYIDYFKLK